MKIALIINSFTNIYHKFNTLYRRGFLNPPLSFGYLAANLERNKHNVIIIDGDAENLTNNQIIERVKNFSPDLIGFTVTSPTFEMTLNLTKDIKKILPNIPNVVGGTHISIFQKNVLKDNIEFDFGIIGDGEISLVELADRIKDKSSFKEVKGLIWRDKDDVIQNEFRIPENNLDIYPFPSRHLFKNELYIRNIPYKGYRIATAFMSTRGCPYSCIYCAVKNIPNGTMVRFRSVDNIIEEIDYIVNKMKINHIQFNDDCLTTKRSNIFELCEKIQKRNLKFTWEGLSRADKVDLEMLKEMKKAGMVRLSFGIESGNENILKILNKQESLDEIKQSINLAHKAGIITRGSVIIGSPYESIKEVNETLKFIKSIGGLDQVVINIMQPYPGTKVYEMALKGEGGTRIIDSSFSNQTRFGNATMEVNDLTREKLIKLQRVGLRNFYFNPGKFIRNIYITNKLSLLTDAYGVFKSLFFSS